MQDVEIIGMLKSYIAQTLIGMGAQKGASCQIQSIVKQGTVSTVTFLWQDNDGNSHTSVMTVNDGVDEVAELSDVTITNLTDGQVLAYDSASHKWVNRTNSASVESLDNVGDVLITSIADGQILKWDDTAGKWVNTDISFSDIKNTPTTIAGYGVEDVYTKTEVNGELDGKVGSVAVNGVSQTVESGAVDIDVASNLITESQWTAINALYD